MRRAVAIVGGVVLGLATWGGAELAISPNMAITGSLCAGCNRVLALKLDICRLGVRSLAHVSLVPNADASVTSNTGRGHR